ncbi:MAG: two-component system, NtrC family, response regulator AlgB [Verrucomicrobia bacterium]|jgi:NtrC-family two-component system response regulator AlgB|nr:MAG: two-component system, NtrC family, response regulator AlgB [Verrucomicrobiota bacterium]
MDILVVDDERNIRDAVVKALEAENHYAEPAASGAAGLQRLGEDHFDLVLLELRPGEQNGLEVLGEIKRRHRNTEVVLVTAHGTVPVAVKAMQQGAFDFVEKPLTTEILGSLLVRVEKRRQTQQRGEESEAESAESLPEPVWESGDPSMRAVHEVLERAAATPASILILGESGTGKSVIAKAVHQQSPLRHKPFVTVSCPSLSRELLESQLFGHVKGAFTGAIKDQWGKVHAANGGTLFLDEIGELPLDIQPKLLRLLQEREYERLGETKTRKAEVRVIAATNRDLRQLVEERAFREDLYYRLHVIAVSLPPLRDRPSDLEVFAEEYLRFFAKRTGRQIKGFSDGAKRRMHSYPWPGNLRELRNGIERAVILAKGEEIEAEELPCDSELRASGVGPMSATGMENGQAPLLGADVSLEVLEGEHLKLVLERCNSMAEAARILGIDQATLYRKRKRMGLS